MSSSRSSPTATGVLPLTGPRSWVHRTESKGSGQGFIGCIEVGQEGVVRLHGDDLPLRAPRRAGRRVPVNELRLEVEGACDRLAAGMPVAAGGAWAVMAGSSCSRVVGTLDQSRAFSMRCRTR